ncbi:MAG TPA: LamG domain-containing protein [Spirochaetota bacterium]|nr:LamG domain-containing protein [Spirochaetota bacterium]HNT10484.1 LamG domain-containing protein [Spirochaetota bacterium]
MIGNSKKLFARIVPIIITALAVGCTDVKDSNTPAGPPLEGLIAYYPFTGNSEDESGNGRHASIHGNPRLTADVNGYLDNAYAFNGSGDFMDTPIYHLPTEFTLAAWIKVNDTSSENPILSKNSSDGAPENGCEFCMSVLPLLHIRFVVSDGTVFSVVSTQRIKVGEWTHVAVRFRENGRSVIIDGQYDTLVTGFVSRAQQPMQIQIGRYHPDTGLLHFNGSIDEVLIYGRALSDGEIRAIYDFGRPW